MQRCRYVECWNGNDLYIESLRTSLKAPLHGTGEGGGKARSCVCDQTSDAIVERHHHYQKPSNDIQWVLAGIFGVLVFIALCLLLR
jgi:hypothetical protein